jgi:AcrR family transcriptional regulator
MPRPSHDRILAAAERVFSERGFGDTSLRELIGAAECSTTAFYARFPSKDAVLETLIVQLLLDLHDAAAEALPRAASVVKGWDEGVEILVATLAGRRGLVRIALTEAGRVEGPRAALRTAYGQLAKLLSAQLRQLAGRGKADVADSDALAWAIVGALTMQVTRWAVFEELDDAGLVDALRSTARTLLPKPRRTR